MKKVIKKINGKNNGVKVCIFALIGIGLMALFPTLVFAAEEANDPIKVVNNLSNFIFQLTRVLGGIIAGYAIVQIGLSFSSHDPSQRTNGFLFFVGGVIIMFAKEILDLISK